MQDLGARWRTIKPLLVALVIGLIAGPIITNMAGWQVTSSSADAAVLASVVEQQASICDAQARMEVPEPAKLDWNARGALAKKWAVMPGSTEADNAVTSACTRKLGA